MLIYAGITVAFRTRWQVEAGRASRRLSESLKDPMEVIIEGLQESNKNLLEAEGNTDTWQ